MIQWVTLPDLSDYEQTLSLMEQQVLQVINNSVPETIYLLEHNDIYTAGTSSKARELLNPGNVPVIYTGRGGKFTYHGKGQRIIYPILDLSSKHRKKDLHLYISMLETWIINSLSRIGVKAYTARDRIGIWVNYKDAEAKIASIGVRIKKWVTYHGIAVNISTDLDKFSGIIPCGLKNFPVTSLAQLGVKIDMTEFDKILKDEASKVF